MKCILQIWPKLLPKNKDNRPKKAKTLNSSDLMYICLYISHYIGNREQCKTSQHEQNETVQRLDSVEGKQNISEYLQDTHQASLNKGTTVCTVSTAHGAFTIHLQTELYTMYRT